MNPILGWLLTGVALLAGWRAYGWQGVLLALTVTVFWLLLQFSRAMRAMKNAAQAPVGTVPSAVMLNAKLQRRMTMLKVIALTRSLGIKIGESPPRAGDDKEDDVWRWADAGGSHVTLNFAGGELQSWVLWRPSQTADEATPPPTLLPTDPRP